MPAWISTGFLRLAGASMRTLAPSSLIKQQLGAVHGESALLQARMSSEL